MTLLAFAGRIRLLSSSASKLGKLNAPPNRESAPTFNVSRRVMPSHRRRLLPNMVIMGILSVPKQEFVRVEKRPLDILPSRALVIGLGHVFERRAGFVGQRRPRKRCQKQLADPIDIRKPAREEPADPIAGRAQLSKNKFAVSQLQRAGQVGVALALALAHRFARRLAERLEKRVAVPRGVP